MLPWVQVYTNICEHPKTTNLVDALGITSKDTEPEMVAVGMLVALWTWAAKNAYNGDLCGVSARAIAKACGWKKDAQKLMKALVDCGWLDDDLKIHDWEEYAELYINRIEFQKEQARERMRKTRAKKKAQTENVPEPFA